LLANRIGADCVIDIAPDNYIRKPVDPSRLLARVRAAVRRASEQFHLSFLKKGRQMSKVTLLALAILVPLAAGAQKFEPKLSIHGYLTQAYGISDKYPTFGLTKEGTADYRRAAILARYAATAVDNFVVQVAHRRLGDSPTMQFEENVRLDLAFYERRFSNGTKLRVGKVTLPFGIYNEVRYAGTLTPFYRAPFVIYRDGTYTSETLDGAGASHVFRGGEPWEMTLDAYGGSFQQLEYGPVYPAASAPVYTGGVMKSKNVLGGQFWLGTPLTGLRVGVSGRRQDDSDGIYQRPAGGADTRTWNASVDGNFDRWLFRAERMRMTTYGFEATAKYAQVGARVLPWLGLNAQAESRDENLRFTPTSPWFDVKAGRDNAVGMNFYFASNAVFKLEAHTSKGYGYMYEQIVDVSAPALHGAYYISSFTVSF
jgi:hypothetical protein